MSADVCQHLLLAHLKQFMVVSLIMRIFVLFDAIFSFSIYIFFFKLQDLITKIQRKKIFKYID